MPSIGNATAQKWKYNDREFEALHGLNVNEMNFRQYDPALGRFGGIDALAGYMPSINPYQFGFNNPVYFSDPTGLLPGGSGDGGGDDNPDARELQPVVINADQSKPHYSGLASIVHLTYQWTSPGNDGSHVRTGGGGGGTPPPRILPPGKVMFINLTPEELDDVRVIPEDAKDKFDTVRPKNNISYDTDGIYFRKHTDKSYWFKIGDGASIYFYSKHGQLSYVNSSLPFLIYFNSTGFQSVSNPHWTLNPFK